MNKIATLFNRISISKKLAFWYGFSLFLMLSLFGFFLYESFHQSIHHNYDQHLWFEAEQLLPHVNATGDTLSTDLSEYSRIAALRSTEKYGTYVRLYNEYGKLIYRSPNFRNVDSQLQTEIPDVEKESSLSSVWQGKPARTLFYPIEDKSGRHLGWLEVTGFEWTLHEEVNRFEKYLFLLIAISVAFSIFGGYLLSRRALSPVSSIIDAAKSITATDLDKRIDVDYLVRDELTDLAEIINMMLDRLQMGFEREKRFTSDAAHELMTPLSSLRSDAEIMLRKPRSKKEYRETVRRMLTETRRMSEMVNLLLQLSRVESVHRAEPDVVKISRISVETVRKHREKSQNKNISIKTDIEPDIHIHAHEAYVEEVLNNLLENAVKYTPDGGKIDLKLYQRGDKAMVELSDTGIGFDEETQSRLFERFYRSDESDVQEQPGSGLGLPVVKAIVELYGGNISVQSEGKGKGSTILVEFPRAKTDNS